MNATHNMDLSRKIMSLSVGAAVVILTLLVLFFVMKLWQMNMAVPFNYSGDSLLFNQMAKSMIDNGWCMNNDFLGAPGGMNLYDFPQPEILHLLIIKLISLFTGDYAATMNLFLIITYPLTALLSWYVLMELGLSRAGAFVGAILYAFMPYHYLKGQTHIFLAAYYMVPMAMLVVMRIHSGELNFFSSDKKNSSLKIKSIRITSLVITALVSATGIYYSFFSCFFLFIAGTGRSFIEKRISPFMTSLLLIALIAFGMFASLSPSLLYIVRNGYNPSATYRVFHETDLYSLKVTKLLLPVVGHRVEILRYIRDQYNRESSYIYRATEFESDCVSLGIIGGVGLLISLMSLLFFIGGNRNNETTTMRLKHQGALIISAVLLAIPAGFSSFLAPFVNYRIRSYSRIGIFIAFISIYALLIVVDSFYVKHLKDRWKFSVCFGRLSITMNLSKILNVVIMTILLMAGLYDQIGVSAVPDYSATKKEYKNDSRFVTAVERELPRGAMIFQLPYLQFPEIAVPPHHLQNFEYFKYYLHSKKLLWSYGATNGRDTAAWQRRIAQLPMDELVRELKRSGFRAICICCKGYTDGGSDIIRKLQQRVMSPPIISPQGTEVLFPL